MANDDCPSKLKCPIFTGVLTDRVITAKGYRTQYCEAGFDKYCTCKRYITKTTYGTCPPDLLPNSNLTTEQIAIRYNLTVPE